MRKDIVVLLIFIAIFFTVSCRADDALDDSKYISGESSEIQAADEIQTVDLNAKYDILVEKYSDIEGQLIELEELLLEVVDNVDNHHGYIDGELKSLDDKLSISIYGEMPPEYVREGITDLEREIIGALSIDDLMELYGSRIDGFYAEEFSVRLGELYSSMEFDDFVESISNYTEDEVDDLCMFLTYNLSYFSREPERLRKHIDEYKNERGSNSVIEKLEYWLSKTGGY